ncbi:MAG: FRG domain-containing protein [Nitrosomonas sp.]|nr:FRG domain-containing protein [Nitrosomonas sp.]
METHLERNVPESVLKETGLERYELKIMTEAQQRFHEFFSQLPDEEDYLSWLSFLRHRGVPTRLLDVTRSLYIACYFAIRDAQPNVDAAVWIFSPMEINRSYDHNWDYKANDSWLRKTIYTVASYNQDPSFPFPKNPYKQFSPPTIETLKHPYIPNKLNALKVIDAAMRGFVDKPGVAFVEPFWISRRLVSQQGAFLAPFNVRYDFEFNLFHMLRMLKIETPEREVPNDDQGLFDLWQKAKIIKLRIPAHLHAILKVKLETMNIRELTLFPDLEGTLLHLSSIIPREIK